MILQKEISNIAESLKIPKTTIDKDWALSHFIAAIFSEPEIKETLVFKGGTCLKKCWFPDYRFSEDLDFTSKSPEFVLSSSHLKFICNHVEANAGILTHVTSSKPILYNNELVGFEANIKFWGADHPKNENPSPPERWHTKIKIEIILYEKLIFPEILRPVIHPYSDKLAISPNLIPSYCLEEVLSEKMRALIQRSYSAPRDFFDIWYLSKNIQELDYNLIINAFYEKMEYKKIKFKGIDQLINPESDKNLTEAWQNSLKHQLPKGLFVDFQTVKEDLFELFTNILPHE
jgi:predicted nucleotidyltransferase component of viral defense system